MRPLFLLRWAARDLRRKWLQVAAIALVIGIGTGTYAGLGSTAAWRQESNDASFARLAMYDLRVKAADESDAARGELLGALATLPDPGIVATAEERLVVPTQVDASTAGRTILVPGRLVGVDTSGGGPHVNGISVDRGHGRALTAADAGQPVVLLERNFAHFHDLPPTTTLRLSGGATVQAVGQAMTPEFFMVMTEEGGFFAEANFAAVFTSLETAQALAGRPGRVNDLVLRLRPGVDVDRAAATLRDHFAQAGPAIGATVMRTDDEVVYRLLYDDIEGDRQFWNVFAALILAGATFGAFNLVSRMVEAQRREIGIGMALGASPRQLALRPLLVGLQIAVLGALFGGAFGMLAVAALRPVYTSMLPLPVWHTEFQPGMFVRGAALSLALPMLATLWPVWRAVRVMPVDAISTTHRTARGGLARLLRNAPWPRGAFHRMPIGNVLRTPRRTLLTALGIGAAIATLVAVLGMLDSFVGTMDRNDREVLGHRPDRVVVSLDRFAAVDGPELTALAAARSVGGISPAIRVAGTLAASGVEPVDVFVEVVDIASPLWSPTVTRGSLAAGGSGVLISEKAAADLGVGPGDQVTLRHPALGPGGVVVAATPVRVAGVHPSPFRFNVYLDRSQLAAFGADGLANEVSVVPAAGYDAEDVERELFSMPGVSSVQPVATSTRILKDSLDQFTGVFRVLEVFILLLVLLIAYNATSINAEERSRERATLFAFGLPVRRVVSLETEEGVLVGLLGTGVGLVTGALLVRWMIEGTVASTMPELGLDVVVSLPSIATAAALGVAAVTAAPLLTIRRLRRIDLPGTLRVVE